MSQTPESWQVSDDAAEIYEARFIPAIFGEWAPRLADAAAIEPGQRVLDVACGTGVVAREAVQRVGQSGAVTGIDLNPGMLAVARRVAPQIEWREGDAAALPFDDESFDTVLCQAALMYFPDRIAALREMGRVVAPWGRVAVQVWGRLAASEGYAVLSEVAERSVGAEAAATLRAPFVLGDLDEVGELFAAAGLEIDSVRSEMGAARFASIGDFVRTEIEGSPIVDRIEEDAYRQLLEDSVTALARFCDPSGAIAAPIEGHLITARVA